MLPNPDGKNFDAIDVCFPQAVGRAPSWNQGDYVDVAGFLQQRDTRENLVHLVRRAEGLGDAECNELTAYAGDFVQQAKVEVVAQQWRYLGKRDEMRSSDLIISIYADTLKKLNQGVGFFVSSTL